MFSGNVLAGEGHQEEERKEELQEYPRQVTEFRGMMDGCRKPLLARMPLMKQRAQSCIEQVSNKRWAWRQ